MNENRKCRECGKGPLEIEGLGYYQDTIEVYCTHCEEAYEVEPDGLGEGGLEMVEAFVAEEKRNGKNCD